MASRSARAHAHLLDDQPSASRGHDVILSYSAYSLHRRLPWFGLAGQALHILPLLLVSQLVVLMIRLWFDGLWPGFPWFLQSFTGALLWPAASLILSLPERRSLGRESV